MNGRVVPASGASIALAAKRLRDGELVAFPTETVYGLGADAGNADAVHRIFAAKGRPSDHPVIVHLANAADVGRWAREFPEGARRLAVTNAGTIPDRGLFGVFLVDGSGRVGELDEEMVFESRVGETFLLGASTWRIEEITHDRVVVSPAPGEPGKMPFWKGDSAGRPRELGLAIGKLARELREMPPPAALDRLERQHDLDRTAGENLLQYLADQSAAGVRDIGTRCDHTLSCPQMYSSALSSAPMRCGNPMI
jgi:hypothetical protein